MRDELKKPQSQNECMVINYDHSKNNGTHWVCLFTKNGESFYFDPYGIEPLLEVVDYCKEPRNYSTFEIQKPNEVICGHYCIYVLYKLSQGSSFLNTLVEMSLNKKHVTFNDTVENIPILNESEWYQDYENARKSDWRSAMLDRERFKRRIQELELLLSKHKK